MSDVPHVYTCIAAVSAEIATTGIAKTRNNAQQGYKFRGIDDVYNAIAPLLAKHGLVIIPRILTREVVERHTKSGGVLNYVTVEAEFDFVSAQDGSKATARSFGEAMDSADKATNKAMSAAYKYTAFQTFCIPTEGDNDADAQTPDVASAGNGHTAKPALVAPASVATGLHVTSTKVAKRGTNAKGPWTLYAVTFSDGREGTTFSKAIYDVATDAAGAGHRVELTLQGKNIFTLKAIGPLVEERDADEEFDPRAYDEGRA